MTPPRPEPELELVEVLEVDLEKRRMLWLLLMEVLSLTAPKPAPMPVPLGELGDMAEAPAPVLVACGTEAVGVPVAETLPPPADMELALRSHFQLAAALPVVAALAWLSADVLRRSKGMAPLLESPPPLPPPAAPPLLLLLLPLSEEVGAPPKLAERPSGKPRGVPFAGPLVWNSKGRQAGSLSSSVEFWKRSIRDCLVWMRA